MPYVLTARKDQLASCWLHNVCEVLFCMHREIEVLLNPYQYYENVPSLRDEPISPLYLPFTKEYDRAKDRWGMDSNWRTIADAASSVVIAYSMDVISAYREMLMDYFEPHLGEALNPNSLSAPSKDSVCVHVRLGDVSHLSYLDSFKDCYAHVVDFFNGELDYRRTLSECLGHDDVYGNCRSGDAWYWGQTSMNETQLRDVLDNAKLHGMDIHIVTHKSDMQLLRIAKQYKATIFANETEVQSISRMVNCRILYIANSYMGFLAGLLRRNSNVHYPRNAMFAIFGLGSVYDTSGWIPFDVTCEERRVKIPRSESSHDESMDGGD
jgi:hypothetical protein